MKHVSSVLALLIVGACSGASTESGNPDGNGNGNGADGGHSGGSHDGSVSSDDDSGSQSDDDDSDGGHSSADGSTPEHDASTGDGSLLQRLSVTDVTIPAAVKAGVDNWRIWGLSSLKVAPVFTVPLANCGSLVCVTTGTTAPHAYAAVLDANDALVRTVDLGAFECRGLAAEPDGHFAALLWANGTASDCVDPTKNGRIYVKRYDFAGTEAWTKELTNPGSDQNCPTDFGIGESRLEYGNGKYGAYYHVHSKTGHEGDTLKYLDLTGTTTTQWPWGCSHSMSNVLRFHPTENAFLPACVTDCYPGTSGSDFKTTSIGGVYTNNSHKVIDVDAGCNGSVAGELGGAAAAPSGWKTVYNAHQAAATKGQSSYDKNAMNQDIGFASIATNLTANGPVWLTTTPSVNEADASIERWQPAGDTAEQYVVGWAEAGTNYVYKLARVDGKGAFLEGPVDATAKVKWGRRDDPFRTQANGDIVWSWFDAAGKATMHFARLRSGGTHACASF